MDNVKKVPEIRFKGFDEEWEETYLEKLGIAISGNGFPLKEQGGVLGTPYIKVSDMNGFSNDIFINKTNNYVTKEQIIKNGWDKISGPSIVFAKVGAAIFLDRKRIVIEPFLIDNNMMSFTPIDGKNIYFLKLIFDNIKLASLVQTGALPSLSSKDIYNVKVSTPSLKEQTQIGTFFKNLDEKLEIEKEKLKKLIDFKKAMLENMFPNTSEKLPKLRFSGFSYEWEYGNLKEFNTKFSDGNYGESYPKNSDFRNKGNGVPFLRGLNLKDGKIIEDNCLFISHQKNDELTSGHLKLDDIVIAVRGSIGALGYVSEKFVENNINSQLAIIRTDKTKINGMYLLSFLLSNIGKNNINSMISGSALKQLPIKNLEKINVVLPTLTEQQQIGEFFQNLDKKIELSKTKIKKIENFKKAMLDKMFV